MPKLYIMCGLAFAGKSTLARKIAEHTDSKLIAFDKLWVDKEKEHLVTQGSEGWSYIRKIAQDEILKSLKEGVSVVYDDNNPKFDHREEIRMIAEETGSESVVIYLNTPLEVIRSRERANISTKERHEVAPENFQKVLRDIEVPTSDENILEFRPDMNIEEFLKKLD